MASAFSNNTADLFSSDRTSNLKAKTNYNYLRLVALKNTNIPTINYKGCNNEKFSSSSGNVILGLDEKTINLQKDTPDELFPPPPTETDSTLAKLVNVKSYDLLNSINKGYYLPTTVSKTDNTNNNINRPPYTYSPECEEYFSKKDTVASSPTYVQPNTSGDLQEILFNEYLDFGDLTIITNTQFVRSNDDDDDKVSNPVKTLYPNQIQVTDASFGDYIIDPDNILDNYKDCDLTTYLGLQKKDTTYNSSDGEKILRVINWKKLQINTFPNNKFHRYSYTDPVKFFNYKACSEHVTIVNNSVIEGNVLGPSAANGWGSSSDSGAFRGLGTIGTTPRNELI